MKRKNGKLLSHIVLVVLCVIIIYPVFWWLGAVFKTNTELTSPDIWPKHPTLDNFPGGWNAITGYSFGHFYINSFKLILSVLFTSILSCSLVAFGFARMKFPLKNFWFSIVLLTLMLPNQVTIIPQYVMFNKFGWVDSYLPFIVPHALAGGIGGSFFIFMLVQFIRGIPHELDEAAKMDGCTSFGIYWRIIMPLLVPALVTMSIFCFLWNWDDFLGHMIYIQSIDKYTVGLALKVFVDAQSSTPWGQLFAMSFLSIMPGTIIFFVAQRYIVEGIATSGLKG
ncbi:L-arabinose transport system permease protein AraQ [Paenibacillus konkukensis]|uniref:L-arabinose transport system permease protein AraQ n=1 Tax=Paenibacillus konkukensis TaxID=2020716 RepID=A0ABY4RM93_9BACL|nr:carbohydrate ABC transporter permease [Paenibacillus konkukensis]UQZ83496.1 L-arabinose transport system permease protein AraQ [Paenibacillus konkukensis]